MSENNLAENSGFSGLPLAYVESPVLVELCAGSAAVSMRSRGRRPPCRYLGGKGRLAARVLEHLGVFYVPSRLLLVDPGPWGKVWDILAEYQDVVRLELLWRCLHEDHGNLWRQFADRVVPEDPVKYAVAFLVLQHLNWRSKPVFERDGRWVTAGIDKTMAYGIPGTERFGAVRPQLLSLPALVEALDLRGVTSLQCSAMDVEPIPGAVVYIDPPYRGTQGYGHDLPRADVETLRDRWLAAGCTVAISEAEPLPGMEAHAIGRQGKSQGLSDGPRRTEWLSVVRSPEPTGTPEAQP